MLTNLSRFLAGFALMMIAGSSVWELGAQESAARVALVIGNGKYEKAPIENAVEGARSVAEGLRQGGFKVFYVEDGTRSDIGDGLTAFGRDLQRGANVIVFYSGHAVQHQGRNFMVAIDSKIEAVDDIRREAVDIDLLLDPLIVARTPASVVILDASRTNPWQGLVPGNLRGLAQPEEVKDISFVFSTNPGRLVGNTPQASAVFAAQLAQAMKTPGIGIDAVIARAKAAVTRINGKDQTVWQSGALPANLVVGPVATAAAPAREPDPLELGFWDTIKNSKSPDDYKAYLDAYPDGPFAVIARARLAALAPTGAGASVAAAPVAPAERPAAPAPDAGLAVKPIRDCPVCPEMVPIPAGKLTMGSTEVFAFESPVHEVTIAKPFYIGRREVTFDEWDACLNDGGCQYRPGDKGQGRGLNPAVDLDWNDAKAYVAWLSSKTQKVYRLPTEAEWEYAARAGTKTTYYWGTAIEKDRANCAGCNTTPLNKAVTTGTFPPNAYGLFDMAGNAAEWVEDCWVDNYKAAPKDGSAFNKPDCRERVLRGGSFNNDQRFVRTAARFKYDFDVRYYTNGFRVVREQ